MSVLLSWVETEDTGNPGPVRIPLALPSIGPRLADSDRSYGRE